MPPGDDLFNVYDCKIEYLFTWYAVRESWVLPGAPLIRGGRYELSSGELGDGLGAGSAQGNWVVKAGPEDTVQVYLEIGVDENRRMYASAMVAIGGSQRTQRFDLPPKERVPFMLNVRGDRDDDRLSGTAGVLHGVIVTSRSIGEALITDPSVGIGP